jgi:hypothetical protein
MIRNIFMVLALIVTIPYIGALSQGLSEFVSKRAMLERKPTPIERRMEMNACLHGGGLSSSNKPKDEELYGLQRSSL